MSLNSTDTLFWHPFQCLVIYNPTLQQKEFDAKKHYTPSQEPPFEKKETTLAVAVICNYFNQINTYYGFKSTDWCKPN